ncbi:D-alanyl-D-alanine carboxypeptidase family protein [Lysinimonas soli]|uniref:D-alanyl-D-alanine carboxypeptidase family protein n=1 Tax=Lysinimonas soli TaxID=1074233 RepID=A0ABW0NQT5_9MICO
MTLTRRQIYHRRRITVFGSIAIALGVAFYLPMTLLAPLQAADAVVGSHAVLPEAAAKLDWPGYGGSAIGAVGYDGVLARGGSSAPMPMASITKIITTLVVLQAKPLSVGDEGPKVTMSAADVDLYHHYVSLDGEVAPVRAGLVFTEHELMQLALVRSANNYAASLAIWAFGSEQAYVTAAKTWLASQKLNSITIADPTGIDPANVAGTSDLVQLGRLALANPVVAAIVATKSVTIHDVGAITNTNDLLGTLGVDGIKTGTLNTFGSNLLFAADYPVGSSKVTVVGVVLGGANHRQLDGDIKSLLTAVKAGFHEVTVATKGQKLASYSTDWGQKVDAVAERSARLVVWSDTPVTSRISAKPVTTGKAGDDVGSAVFTAGPRTVTVPIGLAEALTDPGPGWRLSHPGLILGSP